MPVRAIRELREKRMRRQWTAGSVHGDFRRWLGWEVRFDGLPGLEDFCTDLGRSCALAATRWECWPALLCPDQSSNLCWDWLCWPGTSWVRLLRYILLPVSERLVSEHHKASSETVNATPACGAADFIFSHPQFSGSTHMPTNGSTPQSHLCGAWSNIYRAAVYWVRWPESTHDACI